jgi:hypothetical protein
MSEEGELRWAASQQGAAAIRAAWDRAQDLDRDLRQWATARLSESDVAEIVYAAYLAAGWDGEPDDAGSKT